MKFKLIISAFVFFLIGVIFGGYLFSESVPRAFLEVRKCKNRCYQAREIAGLITSAGILRAPFIIPDVIEESDTCLAIRHPKPQAKIHFVLFPKHDTRDIYSLTLADMPYVMGCFAMIHTLVKQNKLVYYRVHTNGRGLQEIAYLHFHLTDNRS